MCIEKELLEKIYDKVEIDEQTFCFKYTGATNGQGYGRVYFSGKLHSVHRLNSEIFQGPIPKGKEVHHTCGVRNCCNPAHLELVSHRLNIALTYENIALRWQRLQNLLAVNFELHFLGETRMTSTDLSVMWGKNFQGSNLVKYLKTLAFVFENDFGWSLVEKGKGRRPHLFKIKISDSLRERLEDPDHNASLPPFSSFAELAAFH